MSPYVGTFVNPFHPNVEYEWWADKNISSDQCQTVGKDLQFFENDLRIDYIRFIDLSILALRMLQFENKFKETF